MITPRTVENMKRQAKKVKKERGITHTQALDELSRAEGFQNWALLMKTINARLSGLGGEAA